MMRIYLSLIGIVLTLISCASGTSMQKYYIEHQDENNFRAIDIPASTIQLKDNASPQAKQAYKTIKKFNVLAFVKDSSNEVEFKEEKQRVKTILKNKKYKELMRIKDKGRNLIVKYEGTEDAIDEVYLFASDKNQGFAVVRVIGDGMKPEYLSILLKNIKSIDSDIDAFKKLGDLLK